MSRKTAASDVIGQNEEGPHGISDWPYDGHGARATQWWPSRYGGDDELGAAAEVTAEKTLSALQLPTVGRTIGLGRVLESGIPGDPGRTFNAIVMAHNALEMRWAGRGLTDVSSFEEHVEQSFHLGTHIDGLAHVGIGSRFYNGNQYLDVFGITGVRKLGAHNIPPMVTRGVLLDVSRAAGGVSLPEGFPITVAHLKAALEESQLSIDPGDAVLIHTGWGRLWSEPASYAHGAPGLGEEGAIWLARRRPCLIGADNWPVEVVPSEDSQRPFVVHQHLLTVSGIYLLENLDLSELIGTGARQFLFILSSIAARGTTGAPVRPVAVI